MQFKVWLENQGLPPELYHVTTAGNEIEKEGFRTALQHGKGTLLGGSFQDAVSFTVNLNRAKLYKLALEFVQELLYENPDRKQIWYRLQPFKPEYEMLKRLVDRMDKEDINQRLQSLLILPSITKGRFPGIFGAGLKDRVLPDSYVSILKVSTLPGHGKPGPQKWTTNPHEEEYRIYDPENIDTTTIDFIA